MDPDFDLVDALDSTSDFLKKKVDWKKVLFGEFELNPLQELFYIQLCEKDSEFANNVMNDVTEDFKQYVEFRIRKHANVNLILVGEQGCGKSTFACQIFLYIRSLYGVLRKIDLGDWLLTFNTPETLDAYLKIDSCKQIFQDEDDDLQGPNSRAKIAQLGNIIKRVRAWEIHLSICCPELTSIPGCQYAIVPFGFHREGAKKFEETGDSTECAARALLYVKSKLHRDKYVLQGCIFMNVSRAIEYMQKTGYHEAKKKSYEDLKENRGGAGAYTKTEVKAMEKSAKQLIRIAVKKGWDGQSKKALKTYIIYTSIRPTIDEQDKLLQMAFDEYHTHTERYRKSKKEKIVNATDPMVQDEFDVDKLIPEILKQIEMQNSKKPEIKRDITIYANIRSGTKNGEDYVKSLKLSATRISQIRAKITGMVCDILGHLYEQHLYKQYLDSKQYDLVELCGGVGEWDIRLTKKNLDGKILSRIYISAKCMEIGRGSTSISYKQFHPEIEAAKADVSNEIKAIVKAHVYNCFDKKIYEKTIEPEVIQNQELVSNYAKRNFIINP